MTAAVFLAVLMICAVSGLILLLWLRGAFLPRWIRWYDKEVPIHTYEPHPLYTDPGYTGTVTGEALLTLSGRRVTIFEEGPAEPASGRNDPEKAEDPSSREQPAAQTVSSSVYTSPSEWYISDAAAADLTGDGIEEILLLVWKRGHFGGVLPFWVKSDDAGFSQHLYIFAYQEGTLRPVWMASKMPSDVQDFSVTEDGSVRLVTPDGEESFWRWEHWGLKLQENR
ncbi:MAG: hypothetical protein E7240_01740 [Lachnospiraceae bacterium]|nr:hypothetical protein [Lachnospiraceae bacterium]